MPTINVSRASFARVTNQSSHGNARDASTGQAGNLGQTANAFSYVAANAGRGLAFSIYRSFLYFDTTAITGTVSAASVNVLGYSSGGGRRILVPSTAFGGDGSSAIVGSDYSALSFNATYNDQTNGWNTSSNNVFTLKSTALSDMQSNDYFICAILQYDNDYDDVAATSATSEIFGIDANTSSNIYLDYTLSGGGGPQNLSSRNGVAKASISSIDDVSFTSINEINGLN